MTNFIPRSNALHGRPNSFKIMFRLVSAFIILTFVAVIVMIAMIFTGNAPFNYHYEVNYGNGGYSETQTWGNK